MHRQQSRAEDISRLLDDPDRRAAKQAAIMAGRYAHAKQFKRHNRELKFLRIRLGRMVRDIRRKTEGDEEVKAILAYSQTEWRMISAGKR